MFTVDGVEINFIIITVIMPCVQLAATSKIWPRSGPLCFVETTLFSLQCSLTHAFPTSNCFTQVKHFHKITVFVYIAGAMTDVEKYCKYDTKTNTLLIPQNQTTVC